MSKSVSSKGKEKPVCDWCKMRPSMVTCRDCMEPAACFVCTLTKNTGGFCLKDWNRFINIHWINHGTELMVSDPVLSRLILNSGIVK